MDKLIEFYKKILKNVGLRTDNEGYIFKDDEMVMSNGKPLVLPTTEQLNSVLEKNDDGEYVVTKVPFNPLNEDIVKGNSASISKLQLFVEYIVAKTVANIGELLLILASNKELQKNTSLELNKFLSELNKAKNSSIKQLVDDKSIESWVNIFKHIIKQGRFNIKVYLKKLGTFEGVKYNRLAVLSCDTYEGLKEADTETPFCGVKLRNKDIIIFKSIYEFILKGIEEDDTITVGSNDMDSPAFVALFSLYNKIIQRTNKILSGLKHVDPINVEDNTVKELLSIKEIENVGIYRNEMSKVPNDNDLTRKIVSHNVKLDAPGEMLNKDNTVTKNATPYPTAPQPLQQPKEEVDPVLKAYYNSTPHVATGYNPMLQQPVIQQPNIMYQQPVIQPPIVQQPNVMYQQPAIPRPNVMYQQPMMQQPVIQQPGMMYQQPMVQQPGNYYQPQSIGLGIPARRY